MDGANRFDWFRAALAASALIAASGVAYYFALFLPERTRALDEERRTAELKQAQREEARRDTRRRCLLSAEASYSAAWDRNCTAIAEEHARQLPLCIAQGSGRAFCESLYGGTAAKDCRLVALWELLQPFFDENASAIGVWAETRQIIKSVVHDFDRLDPGSFDFRYSANRQRTETTLSNAPERINVARLNTWMMWTSDNLSGVFDAVTGGRSRLFAPGTDTLKLGGR